MNKAIIIMKMPKFKVGFKVEFKHHNNKVLKNNKLLKSVLWVKGQLKTV